MCARLRIEGKIQALKKSVPKGDKKRKKEVAVQISALEEEIKTLSLSEKDDRQCHADACNGTWCKKTSYRRMEPPLKQSYFVSKLIINLQKCSQVTAVTFMQKNSAF